MKKITRIISWALTLILLIQPLSGCSTKKNDETLYMTKGEFFAYYVYENDMASEKYSSADILNCDDGSVEADIIVEWGYLTKEQAEKNLNKPVEKETVVMVCANATFDLAEGNVNDIKDADMLDNPQLIANAYASGFFELENGYFDGAEKMSFADCEDMLNKAKAYAANFHYEANSEKTETAEGVLEQDTTNYSEGDILIEFYSDENISGTAAFLASQNGLEKGTRIKSLNTSTGSQKIISRVEGKPVGGVVETNQRLDYFGEQKITGFSAHIMKSTFERALGNPNVEDTVVMSRYQIGITNARTNGKCEIIGILKSKQLIGSYYVCFFDYPEFEEAIEKKNVTEANRSSIDKDTFEITETEVAGWTLDFDVTGDSVKVAAKKNFTVYETGRKQDWQNAQKTITATANFEISDFNLDVNNLKSFASKSGTGYIKITCDTDIGFSLSQSLRYTPDSNRNGKFPSNWSNSRWTDSDSKGAEAIKIARFSPSFYGVVGVEVYIYLLISVDGKISFATSIADGGVQITANNGKISTTKLGTKEQEIKANVNLHSRLGVDASLKVFTFINVVEYDVGANLDIHAVVNLYYDERLSKLGVYADEEGLDEYAADDGKFSYCIGVQAVLTATGQLQDSGIKMILNWVSKGETLNFERHIISAGFHYENGGSVDVCSRGGDMSNELKKSESDEIELGLYKVVLEVGESDLIWLKAIPSETMDLLDSKNSITVESGNKKVCTATYNKANKLIIVEAVGEGSTEIIIKAKKGILWWKKTCEQKVSVTVNSSKDAAIAEISYITIDPQWASDFCFI